MYLWQLDVVLVGSVVEAKVAVVVIDVAWLREAVQERKHVLEAVAVQVVIGDGYEQFIGRSQRYFGDDREGRDDVDEHD